MNNPLYVKLDEYKDVENVLNQVNERLEETKKEIEELKKIRIKEEEFIKSWEEDAAKVETQLKKIKSLLAEEYKKWPYITGLINLKNSENTYY